MNVTLPVDYTIGMIDPPETVNCSSVYRSTEFKEAAQPKFMHGAMYSE